MISLLKKIEFLTALAFIPLSCSNYQKESPKASYEKADTVIEYNQVHRGMQGKGRAYQWGKEDSMKMMHKNYRMEKSCENKCEGKMNSCNYEKSDTIISEDSMREMEMMKRGMMQGQGMHKMKCENGKMEMTGRGMMRGSGMMDEKGRGMYERRGKMMNSQEDNIEVTIEKKNPVVAKGERIKASKEASCNLTDCSLETKAQQDSCLNSLKK